MSIQQMLLGVGGGGWGKYWDGMGDNWSVSGTTTSGINDYINRALPSNDQVYWEFTIVSVSIYENIGIQLGASGLGTGYNNATVGYYVNSPVGNPPLFLTNGGGLPQISHGVSTGTTWAAGKKLMFAWDSTGGGYTGKFYLGYDGTWYNSGDPEAGTGAVWTGMNTTQSWYMKCGYRGAGGHPGTPITNVSAGNAEFRP